MMFKYQQIYNSWNSGFRTRIKSIQFWQESSYKPVLFCIPLKKREIEIYQKLRLIDIRST